MVFSSKLKTIFIGVSVGLAFVALPAYAAYTVNIAQSGGDVVATGSGSINTTDLGAPSGAACVNNGFVRANGAVLCPNLSGSVSIYTGVLGPATFGSGGGVSGTSATGSGAVIFGQAAQVAVPLGYVSGSSLSGTVTWVGTTISALGLTPGTYTWTWGAGGNADSFVLNIGAAPPPASPVPTLSEWALILFGSLMAGAMVWYQRRRV